MTKLRVRIVLTVDVDRDDYDAEYNERATARDIRDHLEGIAASALASELHNVGLDSAAYSVKAASR
jgi:hypothetical protein